jgi:ABC-type lipoprotein release transport system permease subunit
LIADGVVGATAVVVVLGIGVGVAAVVVVGCVRVSTGTSLGGSLLAQAASKIAAAANKINGGDFFICTLLQKCGLSPKPKV